MARGEHPNSRANLKPFTELTEKEQRKIARAGGKASGEARAVYKSLNADLREQATPEVLADINKRLLQMAKHGNLKAYELLRDGLGEKPVEKHEQNVAFNSEKLDSVFNQLGGQGLEE